MTSKTKVFSDIDDCIYLGSKATPTKYIARVKLPDESVVHAWCDERPTIAIGSSCSVEHLNGSETYNMYV